MMAECSIFIVMLSFIMLYVVMLSVVMMDVVMLTAVMFSVVILCVIMLNVVMVCVVILDVVELKGVLYHESNYNILDYLFVVSLKKFIVQSSHISLPKFPRPSSLLLVKLQTVGHHFNRPFNQEWHLASPPCINTFACLQINQYLTGLKCVSYSITQIKAQLHETFKQLRYTIY